MEIVIKEEKFYGKLLGGCVYAGFPIENDIRICLGKFMFMELSTKMTITEALEYKIILDWGSDTSWGNYKYKFSKESMKELLANIDYKNDNFLGISIGEDIDNDDAPVLMINNLTVQITNENREAIYNFLDNFSSKIKELYEEIDKYYDDHKNYIVE
jgi:hypothetical protein